MVTFAGPARTAAAKPRATRHRSLLRFPVSHSLTISVAGLCNPRTPLLGWSVHGTSMRHGFALYCSVVSHVLGARTPIGIGKHESDSRSSVIKALLLQPVRDRIPVYRVPYTGFRFLHDMLKGVDRYV